MFMMLPRIDEIADIVQDGRELQPFAFPLPKSMQRFRLIEQADSQLRHMQRRDLRGMAAASQGGRSACGHPGYRVRPECLPDAVG